MGLIRHVRAGRLGSCGDDTTSSCSLSTYDMLGALLGPGRLISFRFCNHPRSRCCFDLLFQREKLRLRKTSDSLPGPQLNGRGARPEPQVHPTAVDTDGQWKPTELCLEGQRTEPGQVPMGGCHRGPLPSTKQLALVFVGRPLLTALKTACNPGLLWPPLVL